MMVSEAFAQQIEVQIANWMMRKAVPSAVRRVGELPVALATDVGTVREENQDRVVVVRGIGAGGRPLLITALADGMGGMAEGARCAALCVGAFVRSCISNKVDTLDDLVAGAAFEANAAVYERYRGDGGATLSAVVFDGSGDVIGINVGDSRIYAFQDGELMQETVDDTLAEHLGRHLRGDAVGRNELLQHIGMGKGIEPHTIRLYEGAGAYLLTSDGLHYLDKSMMELLIRNSGEPAVALRRLVEVSKWCGGRDNSTGAIVTPPDPSVIRNVLPDIVEVWDSFGELRLINAKPASGSASSPSLSTSKKEALGEGATERRLPLRPKPRKRKLTKPKKVQGEREAEGSPTLKIDFDEEK